MIPLLLAASVWSVDAIMALRTIHDPQVSPAGDKVAYVIRHADAATNSYVSAIWLKSAGAAPQPLPSPHRSDASPRWSPDGRQLAFLSRRDGGSQIYLSPSRQVTHSKTGIEFFQCPPDATKLPYLAPLPITLNKGKDLAAARAMMMPGQNTRNEASHNTR